jgi:hypothetical protein
MQRCQDRLIGSGNKVFLIKRQQLTKKSPEALQHPTRPVTQAMPVNMKKKANEMMQHRLKCSHIDPSKVLNKIVALDTVLTNQKYRNTSLL